jgi:hypothetical protein
MNLRIAAAVAVATLAVTALAAGIGACGSSGGGKKLLKADVNPDHPPLATGSIARGSRLTTVAPRRNQATAPRTELPRRVELLYRATSPLLRSADRFSPATKEPSPYGARNATLARRAREGR